MCEGCICEGYMCEGCICEGCSLSVVVTISGCA